MAIPVFCDCGFEIHPRTSWTSTNPGRRFISCPVMDKERKCKLYMFIDEEIRNPYYKKLLFNLHLELQRRRGSIGNAAYEEIKDSRMEMNKMMHELTYAKSKIVVYEKLVVILLIVVVFLAVGLGFFSKMM